MKAKTKLSGNYLHVSGYGRAARRYMPKGVPAGITYNIGANKRKREAKRAPAQRSSAQRARQP